MNRITAILPLENILLDVDCGSKKRVFEFLGIFFENKCSIPAAVVSDHLFARERLGSTGLGKGVAIPHGRIKSLKTPMATFLRLKAAVGFDAPDNQAVQLLVVLLVPEAATVVHLEILSELAELLSDENLRNRFLMAEKPEDVYQIIHDWLPSSVAA